MVKEADKANLTAAIGDGGNDVSMIQGGDSIDILDGLNPSLNPSLKNFSIQCLP